MSNINIIVAAQVQDAVTGLNKVTQSTQRVQNQVDKASSTLKKHSNQYNSTAVATNKWAKGALQQAGYQVGDFAVQVAGGTNAMQAFGQQGSQLAGVFGPLGAVVGAGIAIFSAVAVAFTKASEASGSAGINIDNLRDSVSRYSAVAKSASSDTYQLAKEFGDAAYQASTLFEAQKALSQIKAVNSVRLAMKGLRSEFGDFGEVSSEALEKAQMTFLELGDAINKPYELTDSQFKSATDALDVYKTGVKDLQKQLGIGQIEAFDFALSLSNLAEATNIEDTVSQLQGVYNVFSTIVGGVENATEEQRLLMQKIIDSAIETLKLKANMDGVGGSIDDASRKMSTFGKTALSVVEATYMLNRGLLPPQARADLKTLDTSYEDARKKIEEAAKAAGSGSSSRGKGLANVIKNELSPELKRAIDLGNKFGGYFENSLMNAIKGTQSVKDAFKSMASSMIEELYRVFVVKRITGFISDAVSMAALPTGRANTGTMGLPSFAGGGYTGSASRSGGLDGKGGFMAMLHPRETVVDHTKGDTGGGQVVVNQTINISTGVQQTVRSEIKTLMPQIADAAKSAVADAKRRGGSYGRAMA